MAASSVKGIVAVILISHCTYIASWAKCVVDVNKDFNNVSPLFVGKKTFDIVYPEKSSPRILNFDAGQEELVHCAGHEIARFNVPTGSTSEVVKCVKDQKFTSPSNSVEYSFKDLSCLKHPDPVTKEDSRRTCNRGVIVNIGYNFSPTFFKPTIDLCYIKETMTTAWSHTKIPGSIGGSRSLEFRAPSFSKGPYFKGVSISQVYPKTNQQQTFMKIFNDETIVDYFLPPEGNRRNYFVKGHLVARADLFYPMEQRSTYFYVNTVPMWQSINNGNWKSVESTVRRIASVEGDLDVWTGGLGVLELGNADIYLARDKRDQSKRLMPAPKLLFKLVYSESKNEALVFVTANNPHLDEGRIPNEYKICKKYRGCNDKYKLFKRTFQGYTYCCLVEDFLNGSIVYDLNLPVNFSNVQPLTLA